MKITYTEAWKEHERLVKDNRQGKPEFIPLMGCCDVATKRISWPDEILEPIRKKLNRR